MFYCILCLLFYAACKASDDILYFPHESWYLLCILTSECMLSHKFVWYKYSNLCKSMHLLVKIHNTYPCLFYILFFIFKILVNCNSPAIMSGILFKAATVFKVTKSKCLMIYLRGDWGHCKCINWKENAFLCFCCKKCAPYWQKTNWLRTSF